MTTIRARLRLLLLLLAALGGIAAPGRAGDPRPADRSPRVIVALMPGASLAAWSSPRCPELRRIVATGALALMNTRTARLPNDRAREPEAAAVLSLAAGARCAAPPSLGFPFPPGGGETRTCPGWARLETANASVGYRVRLGNLTESLRAAGVPVIAEGTGWSCLFAADAEGNARIEPLAGLDPNARWVWTADLGTDAARADAALGRLAETARRKRALLLIVSPFASDADYARDRRLTPAALWGDGVSRGLLFSRSTRRAGLICNTDLAPTLAAWFGTSLQTEAFGRSEPLSVAPADRNLAIAAKIARDAGAQRSAMRVLPYFALVLGIWLLATWRWPIAPPEKGDSPWRRGIAAGTAAGMLSLLAARTPAELAAAAAAAAVILAVASASRLRLTALLTAISAVLVSVMTVDTLFGSPLMRRSVLGYSPIEGARYYGIGNEGMGVFLAASLILADGFWRSGRKPMRWAAFAVMAACVVVLGHFGAKAGGIAVATGLFGAYLYTAFGGRWTPGRIALIPCAAAVATVLFALLDLRSGGSQAHLGFEMRRVLASGLPEAWSVISRKLAVELHLMWHSTWAVPLWIGLWLAVRSATAASPISVAVLTGTLLTLAFNDAGVVAAALFLAYARCFQIAAPDSATRAEGGIRTPDGAGNANRPGAAPAPGRIS